MFAGTRQKGSFNMTEGMFHKDLGKLADFIPMFPQSITKLMVDLIYK